MTTADPHRLTDGADMRFFVAAANVERIEDER